MNERHHPAIIAVLLSSTSWMEATPLACDSNTAMSHLGVPRRLSVDSAAQLAPCCPSCLIKSLDDISAQNKDDRRFAPVAQISEREDGSFCHAFVFRGVVFLSLFLSLYTLAPLIEGNFELTVCSHTFLAQISCKKTHLKLMSTCCQGHWRCIDDYFLSASAFTLLPQESPQAQSTDPLDLPRTRKDDCS